MNHLPTSTTLHDLIEKRWEGRLTSLGFSNSLKRKRKRKGLSRRTVVHSTERSIVSLQIHPKESRYLITGSTSGKCTIYDLSRHGAEQESKTSPHSTEAEFVHKPIAQTNPTMETDDDDDNGEENNGAMLSLIGPVTCTKWYAADSGAFLSSHVSGNFCLWDTNAMACVLQLQPFASDRQAVRGDPYQDCRSAILSSMETTSLNPHLVAMASQDVPTIRLVDLRTGAASHSLTGHKRGGVTALAWSTTVPHVLCSGGSDTTVRLWDIRKAGRHAWIGEPLDMDPSTSATRQQDPLVRTAYRPDYSHMVGRTRTSPTHVKSRRPRGPNDFSESKPIQSHRGAVTSVAFCSGGQYLVSCGYDDDGVRLWDLQSRQVVPRQFQVSGGKGRRNRLLVQDEDTLWMTQGSQLHQFDVHAGGKARQRLVGHLKSIQAIDTCADTGNLVSGGADGLVLVWGPACRHTSSGRGRKRKTLLVDQDNW